ncbi:hypothetical protein XA68_11538 [Ophiocordyceps unilateralis]|uniref:Uncharacterized protein n=1 Tax=Ophiocordyceps unilateralis TaxID=268505 RepID=A0A2A9P245_OPHUN|nr:hypothetical protein XA68_11538 [Ophiocordyceps unilateralis]
MWPTIRTLGRFLEPGTPTGLTGLWTQPTPRSTLLSVYRRTLNKLQSFPETSVYRQSVEAVTKYRLSLVEQMKPSGHQEWAARARVTTTNFGDRKSVSGSGHESGDLRHQEWNSGEHKAGELAGFCTATERGDQTTGANNIPTEDNRTQLEDHGESIKYYDEAHLEDEPQLTAAQVKELEKQISAGLIEEVIQVAEAELRLVDELNQARIWENYIK